MKLMISIGGFHGPHYDVCLERGRLRCRADDSRTTVTPSAQEWKAFWASMDQIGVWGWETRYDDLETTDGTQWSIEISDGARSLRSFGSNRYPGGSDRETAKPFREFLAAVSTLIQQPFS